MAVIYARKIFSHDITHEVSFTQYIHHMFFGGRFEMTFVKGSATTEYHVTANNATDLRFGGDFKTMLPFFQEVGDFIEIERTGGVYSLRYYPAATDQAKYYNSLLGTNQRHLLLDNGKLTYRR